MHSKRSDPKDVEAFMKVWNNQVNIVSSSPLSVILLPHFNPGASSSVCCEKLAKTQVVFLFYL